MMQSREMLPGATSQRDLTPPVSSVLEAGPDPTALALLRQLKCQPDFLLADWVMPDGITGRVRPFTRGPCVPRATLPCAPG
jgi:hypothetical protein